MSNNYGEHPFSEDPNNIQEAIPHSGRLPEDMREEPVREFNKSLQDAVDEKLIQTPDTPQGIAPEPSTVAPHDPTPTNERLTHEAIRAALPPTPLAAPRAPIATPEQPGRGRRNIAIAAASAVAVAAIGGGAFLLGRHGSDNESAAHPKQSPVASANVNPGTSLSTTENSQPETGEQQRVTVGNIDLSSNLYTLPEVTDDSIIVNWGLADTSQNIYLAKLLGPANYTPTQRAASALNLIAASVSADIKYSPQLVPYLTDGKPMASTVEAMNSEWEKAASPENRGKHVDQLDFFDTTQDPVTFVEGPTDQDGYPTLQLSSGTLYAQRITGGAWQNPANFDTSKATPIKQMFISYKPSANGYTMSIEGLSLPDLMLDQLTQIKN